MQEMACSLLRPPNTTATLGRRGAPGSSIAVTLPARHTAGVSTPPPPPHLADAHALSQATLAVVAGRPPRAPDAPFSAPVTFASTYVAGGNTEYGRYGNPTWSAFEEAVGALEGGKALAFASGLATVSAVLSLLPDEGVAVVPETAYAGTLELFAEQVTRVRGQLRTVDVTDADAVAAACTGADLLWVESPTNPQLEVADLPAAAVAARREGTLLAVDSTFATPLGQRPLDLGSHLVVHSATKLIAGHSDVLLGVVVTMDDDLAQRLDAHRRLHGAVPGPMEAWLALRGLRTLAIRYERAERTAALLVERLTGDRRVTRVRYPGSGTLLAIEVAGGARAADAIGEHTRLWVHATSLGGVESTLERRRRWASESAGVSEALVRLSVGIEDPEDLWRDLDGALG
jgi:cystathionine gamma-synthase